MKVDFKYRNCLITLLLIVGFFPALFASNATILVVRRDNSQTLADVIIRRVALANSNVLSTKGEIGFTNADGLFNYSFTQPIIIQLSYLGFVSITDTIYVVSNKTYTLEPTSQSIKDVVITGQYGANSSEKSVYEVKVISSEMIRAKGANNLREALQNELSIDLGQDQVFGSSLGINGLSGESIKIMVDGVPIVGRLDGKLDLSQININNIERIEIVEGPLSVMYGTDAMGGVINIITKTFQAEKVNLNLKAYYESVGQYNLELNAGFTFKKHQLFVSGGRNFFNGFSVDKSVSRVKDWKPKEQYFADIKYILNGNRYRFSATGAFFRELLLNRGAATQNLVEENGSKYWTYVGSDQRSLTYRPRASASFMYRFKEGMEINAMLAYTGFFRQLTMNQKNLITGIESPVYDRDTASYQQVVFRATYNLSAWKNRLNMQFGTDINQEYTLQNRIQGNRQQLGDYAFFGVMKIALLEGLDIQPAVRFAYNTKFRTPLLPSVNIKYNYKTKLVARVSYGRGYRAPSLKELYLTFFDSNHALKGDENLVPEDGHNLTGSFSYTIPIKKLHSITLATSGFYNSIKNKIDYTIFPTPGPELDTFQYFNLKKYVTYGGDISIAYNFKRLQLRAAGQITQYRLSTSSSNSLISKIASPDVTLGASYVIPKAELGITVTYKYTGIKPLFGVNSSYQTGTRNAFHWLDISVTRNFWKDRIQLTVGGKNLIGVTNVGTDNSSGIGHNFGGNSTSIGWGRTFFTSLVLHFGK